VTAVTEPPRVAFIARDPWHGRSASLIRAIEQRVRSTGLFAPRIGRLFDTAIKLRHVHPVRDVWRNRVGFSSGFWNYCTRDIARQLAGVEYDVILYVYPILFAPPADARYGVFTDNTMAVTQRVFPEWAQLTRRERARSISAEGDVFRAASFVAVTGEQARSSAVEDYRCDPAAVHVVGVPVLLPIPAEFPARAEGAPDTVLFVATTFERKGGRTLVDAWRLVERSVPSARLLIVGPKGPAPAGLPESCEWLGPRTSAELPELYRRARVFVLPTKYESSLPNVIREAMAYGLPVVASRVPGYAEVFPDPEWLFPVGDADELAGKLTALLSDRELAAEIGRRYHADAARRFDLNALAGQITVLLTEAASS
jgi:glycosyltransferase involved in cell wall biosynthesis